MGLNTIQFYYLIGLSYHVIYGLTVSEPGEAVDYCQFTSFNPTCKDDEVIIMKSALYGVIPDSDCLANREYGQDCIADVLKPMDHLCSGRQNCEVVIPQETFHQRVPCQQDKMTWLRAKYECQQVATKDKNIQIDCAIGNEFPLTNQTGYIASTITDSSGIGGDNCPWSIVVDPGQRVNLTLMDFSDYVDPNPSRCQIYARIIEENIGKEITVCQRHERLSHIYESRSNRVQVMIMATSTLHKSIHFVIHYQALGCPDMEPLPQSYVTRNKPDQAVVRCNHTTQKWHLVCKGTEWVGDTNNCSEVFGTHGTGQKNRFLPPHGLLIAILIGIFLGIIIGLALLCIVLYCRRLRKKRGFHYPNTVIYKDQAHIIHQQQGGEYGYSHVWELQGMTQGGSQSPTTCGATIIETRKLSAGGCGTAGEHLAMTLKSGISTSCAAGDLVPMDSPEFHQPMCAAHPQNPSQPSACEAQNRHNEATLGRTKVQNHPTQSPKKGSTVKCPHVTKEERIEGLKGDYIPPTEASSEDSSDDTCTDPLTGRRGMVSRQIKPTAKGYRPIPVQSPVVPTSQQKKPPAPPIRSVTTNSTDRKV